MKNENQEKVVTNIDGFVLVDAGAGTGKTYTITKRYLNILQQLKKKKKTAQELLLLTFTRNAALNMKSRIIAELEVDDITQVADSMITTFDSLSNKVVASFGIDTPKVLGIKESLTNYNLVINKYVLKKDFNEFFNNYLKNNKPHYDWLCLIKNVDEIRTLLETLASRAIIPTNDGWLLDGEEKLLGSFDEWKSIFDNANIPSKKSKPSVIYAKMKDKLKDKDKVYYQASELLEQKLQISDVTAKKAFKEDRSNAINILRDIYYRYIIHLLQNNIMTFNMISIFSYLTLLHNSDARNAFQHDYVMVDEFQDTNEMQFLTTLLLLKQPNLCVVGDWKQGIFGFRNATIENITDFENRVKKLIATLNTGEQRISFDFPKSIVTVQLTINYRSAQKILDASSFALTSKATQKENLEITEVQKKITQLTSLHDENYKEYSQISFLHNEPKATMLDEITIIIKNIKNLVNNSFITEYTSEGGYKKRKIEYKDIALLSRNANFLINFKKEAERAGIPVISEGRSFIYETQAAVLILAWFRYLLDSRHKAARLAINQFENLVQANFSKTTLKEKATPLKKYIKYPVSLAYAILQMYQLENTASEAIIQDLKSIWNSSLMTLGDFALMLEDFINNPDGVNLDNQATHNSVKIQTMHASKGLEYNVVFVANINRQIFPSFKSKYDRFIYNDTVGFRGKKQFIKEHNIICDNWKTALVLGCLDSDYQEERQLLYVAITRARFKLFFSAYRPSSFYNELLKNIEDEAIVFSKDGKDRENTSTSSAKSTLQNNTFDKVKECNSRFLRLPIASLRLPTGSLRPQDDGFSKRGAALGNKIHFQLERYCLTGEVEPQEELIEKDYMNAIKFLKQQDDLIKIDTEVECQLALPSGIIVYGRIDVLLIKNKCIDIIDWKSSQADEPNYQIQLSFYYHAVVKSQEKEVKAFVFKTFDGNLEQIDCLSIEELDNLTQKFVKSSQYLTLDN